MDISSLPKDWFSPTLTVSANLTVLAKGGFHTTTVTDGVAAVTAGCRCFYSRADRPLGTTSWQGCLTVGDALS